MRAPLTWLRDFAALPEDLDGRGLGEALIRAGLEVETVEKAGSDVVGPLVIGRVLSKETEVASNGKKINYCRVDVGEHNGDADSRGIVCGAQNFETGDFVVVALPGAELPGGFRIAARKTYGHVSDGMICSASELGLGDDHRGIMVLADPDVTPGDAAAPVLHLRDEVLDIAVTPDRGYCLSMRGIAREAALATGSAFTDPVDRPVPAETEPAQQVGMGYPVRLESDACPLFVAVSVAGVDPSRPSPRWLARRLQLAGMRSISLAVDITNHVMLETGQPIHAYDADLLQGDIVVRQAVDGDKLTTLDDVTRSLDPGDLVITDDSGVIGLAGTMGGATTELSAKTANLVVEAAHFDAMTVARMSRRHKLSSEASRRFERGVDPAATYAAAHRVASLLAGLAGGTVDAAETVRGTVPEAATTVLDAGLPQRILGRKVDQDTVVGLIRRVGAQVSENGAELTVTAPTWRPDLRDPYDYVEEVGRLLGYDTIEAVVPPAPAGRGLTRSQRARRMINTNLAAAGFVEVLSFPFVSTEELDRLGLDPADRRRDVVTLANPLSETQPYLRTTVLPGLLAAVARNTSRSNDDLALYEAGSIFLDRANGETVTGERAAGSAPRPAVDHRPGAEEIAALDDALPSQPRHLAAALAGQWQADGWSAPAEQATWSHAVSFVETAARAVGLTLSRRAAEMPPWHPGRCAEISIAGTGVVLGYAGELHPQVCRDFEVPQRTCAVEVDLDLLIAAAPEVGEVRRLSTFPVTKEDVALIVDEEVPAGTVEQALRTGAGDLLESVRLFDVYRGEQIGAGKKSLAFALRFRAIDRTLTDAEAGAARDRAVAAAAQDVNAVQRTG